MLSEHYRTRPIRFLDLWEVDEWKLKAYSISYAGESIAPALVDAALKVTLARLKESASASNHYQVGFVGIHQGKTGNFVFVDWWADENELHHHVYVSSSDEPDKLEYTTPSGLNACAWDLYLIGHERDAWFNHVLKKSEAPDLAGYLGTRLNDDVLRSCCVNYENFNIAWPHPRSERRFSSGKRCFSRTY